MVFTKWTKHLGKWLSPLFFLYYVAAQEPFWVRLVHLYKYVVFFQNVLKFYTMKLSLIVTILSARIIRNIFLYVFIKGAVWYTLLVYLLIFHIWGHQNEFHLINQQLFVVTTSQITPPSHFCIVTLLIKNAKDRVIYRWFLRSLISHFIFAFFFNHLRIVDEGSDEKKNKPN